MVEIAWIVQSLKERTGIDISEVVQATLVEAGLPADELSRDDALALLDRIKQHENAVLSMAASMLKVQIIMLMQTRSRLAWIA